MDPDYEQLRNHLGRSRLEHPIARQQPAEVAAPAATARSAEPRVLPRVSSRVSVMDWLSAIGRAAVRRVRGAPRSALARLHPRK
jgi:hypothetical protein